MSQDFLKKHVGKLGETLAVNHLVGLGYKILERNFKARYGEIDIIARDKNIVVFIEVKTRKNQAYGTPEEAITSRKLKELIMTAQFYMLHRSHLPQAMRIDSIGIMLTDNNELYSLNHIKNISQ